MNVPTHSRWNVTLLALSEMTWLPFRLRLSGSLWGCPQFPQFMSSGSFSSQNHIHRFGAHWTR